MSSKSFSPCHSMQRKSGRSFRRVVLAAVVLVATSDNLLGQSGRSLHYVIKPLMAGANLSLRVDLYCKGSTSGTTRLQLPEARTDTQNRDAAHELVSLSPDTRISPDSDNPRVVIIIHRRNQKLHIRYELAQPWAGEPPSQALAYGPVLRQNYFHFTGGRAWVYPQDDKNPGAPFLISLHWKDFPKNWSLSNSFGAKQYHQQVRVPIYQFVNTVYVGGDFRLLSVLVYGNPVWTAVRGKWKFSDQEFLDTATKVMKIEQGFWQDHNFPYYLVTLLPLQPPTGTRIVGGRGLTNSFASFASAETPLKDLQFVIVHELFHNWNSLKFGALEQPEAQLYWFTEGFTNYYTWSLLLRSGLIPLNEYLDAYNQILRVYYNSPVRHESNQRIVVDFFKEYDVGQLPYQRGFLVATNWNALIRRVSGGRHSLDDVMLDILHAAQNQDRPQLTESVINSAVQKYSGQDMMPELKQYIQDGEMISPAPDGLGPCFKLQTVSMGSFELGFDSAASRAQKKIVSVQPGSEAYKAGLRDGQTLVKLFPITRHDSAQLVQLVIKDGEQEKKIQFHPASNAAPMPIPQYQIKPELSPQERASCSLSLSVASVTPVH